MDLIRRLLTAFVFAQTAMLGAADWPIYRGVNRDGISLEKGWKDQWKGDGPVVVWETEVGLGFASFTVSEGRVLTTGYADDKDTVYALDAKTGKTIWSHDYPSQLGDRFYEGGTSATPTIEGGRVFHLSRWGDVMGLDAATGKVVWSRNLHKDFGYTIPEWGFAGSPIVLGGKVIFNAGAAGIALDAKTGAEIWKSGNDTVAGYSTPYPIQMGERSLLVLAAGDLYQAIDPGKGDVVWQIPWKTRYSVNAADPIQKGDQLFISSGYNKGCGVFDLRSAPPEAVWENKTLKNQFNSSVLIDGFLYGIDDDENKRASLKCVEWATGKERWREDSIGFGAVMAADGKLIIQTEKGELVIAKADPASFSEISRAQVLSGRCWTTPVLSHGLLYVRNSTGTVKCLDLR